MGMEAYRHVEFNCVELAASVEKAVADPMEKAALGPCTGEGRGGQEARWRGRRTGWRALAQRR
jgi:hypothetical protein